jgi:16S rRNA (guanine(966)-N(2))-methyltransferase RsmD
MRVITGKARGVRLREPEGAEIRPTTDMVKESVFNIIQYDIEGRSALDLFAGTGQLGIEALSRGAESCVFVDESPAAIRLVRENLEKTKLAGGRAVQADALKFLSGPEKYDLIFLDPPYSAGLLEKSLKKVTEFDKLNTGGIIVCESPAAASLPDFSEPYRRLKSYRYGKIAITIYTKI